MGESQPLVQVVSGTHRYPKSHWIELSRFVTGNERDPKDLFFLAADVWDVWPYAAHGLPSKPGKHRFHFGHLHSFLKPYIKWYCYRSLLARNGTLSRSTTILPNLLTRTDTYLVEHQYESLDDIASESAFVALWNAQLLPEKSDDADGFRAMVRLQVRTHPFWIHVRINFGVPQVIPPTAPYEQVRVTEAAYDESKVIPLPVIRQLVNKLALHREGREPLNRFHHLRLCVLLLNLALGRRISEVLMALRGTGPDGPLTYYPAKRSASGKALWFQFSPHKNGPQDRVYVSSEWEDEVIYCVKELIRYSDEVRDVAPPEIQEFLILISHWNETCGSWAALAPPENSGGTLSSEKQRQKQKEVSALSYDALFFWLHGHQSGQGILQKWKITSDGSSNGDIYHLRTHQARHTRQSAIASDPQVSPLTLQRDLNHIDRNMQTRYQHNAWKQNKLLLEKATNGEMVGPAVEWFAALFGTSPQDSGFQLGKPQPLPPRWRNLILNNPQFMQPSRVSCGYCALPHGPGACKEYMNCLEAADGGCEWFFTDPGNAGMLIQITKTVRKHQQQEQKSTTAGHVVQAGKAALFARRSEAIEKEVYSRCDIEALPNCSQDLKERLKARRSEIKEEEV